MTMTTAAWYGTPTQNSIGLLTAVVYLCFKKLLIIAVPVPETMKFGLQSPGSKDARLGYTHAS